MFAAVVGFAAAAPVDDTAAIKDVQKRQFGLEFAIATCVQAVGCAINGNGKPEAVTKCCDANGVAATYCTDGVSQKFVSTGLSQQLYSQR